MSILNKIGNIASAAAPIAGIFNPVVGAALGAGGSIANMAVGIDTTDPAKQANVKAGQVDPNMANKPSQLNMANQISDPSVASSNPDISQMAPNMPKENPLSPGTPQGPKQKAMTDMATSGPSGPSPDANQAPADTLGLGKFSQWSNALAFGQQALNLGTGIWNATRKPNELPQVEEVKLDRVDYGTEALQANMDNTIKSNTANAIYQGRGFGFGADELTGTMGNQAQQQLQAAGQIQQVTNQERDRNAEIQRTEEMTNVGQRNQRALENANYLNNFDMQRGAMITQGVSNIPSIEKDRMNTQMNLSSLGRMDSFNNFNDEYDRLSASGSKDLIGEDGKLISRNDFINKKSSLYRIK